MARLGDPENIHSSAVIEIPSLLLPNFVAARIVAFSRDVGLIHFEFQSLHLLPQIKVSILRGEIAHTYDSLCLSDRNAD